MVLTVNHNFFDTSDMRMSSTKENLKLVDFYLQNAVSTNEARKEMNEEELRDLSIVSGWTRETTENLNIQFVDPLINVIWKFYHFVPINITTIFNKTHINGLISQFISE